jgi:hypothetical protein
MSEELKVGLTLEYGGVKIEYLEDANKWRFELRGRERKAESLQQAKEWIDKPEPTRKPSKTFKRFEALFSGGWTSYGSLGHAKENRVVVTVTSAASDVFRGTNTPSAAWILKGKERSKEAVGKLFEISQENSEKWKKFDAYKEEIARLEKEATALLKSIKNIDLTGYLDGEE